MPKLMKIVGNYFRKLQRDGKMIGSFNTPSICDVKDIFMHLSNLKSTGKGYRDRLVFTVGLATGLRPTALHILQVQKLRVENVRGTEYIMFHTKTAGDNGECKRSTVDGKQSMTEVLSFQYNTRTCSKIHSICTKSFGVTRHSRQYR